MAKIKIVTDSSCGVTDQEVADYDITIVPLTVMIDDTIYVERETISNEEFLTKMQNSKALPKTSQPPIGKFVEVFDKLGADGSQVICFNMLEAISGTVHAAEQAAQLSKTDVTVVDSQTTDRALAFQVIEAAKLAQAGKNREEILKAAEDIRDHTKLYMGVMTLDNLVKGGRINRMTGMISGLLNIKIVLQVTGGELKVVAKGRGMKTISRFFDDVYEKMAKSPNIKSIGISHVGALKTIAPIKAKIQEMFPDINILVRETVPIIATHGGPGAFALMYYTGD
ncbi:DegV family protein [Pediococcus ethanolidurans]|uniref:DegV family protein n=1 Tax=Pediococcus ethanolidurans TaxID=319653 RepID=UPI001C1F0F1B|nr:DegV family protein [Pediococcus ethanolidurans]MBU7555353.1 DegV family protein [Pediococcus ethanolidurans]MBU7563931.1 DegV family protein [Pediococcus ethanolidurans]MCT4397755.1 DegV family protein [Pediococcus ethanolidurans]MCV3315383.1 DegV family protein [Pediococcus ethanolidurans]MCV3321735.1 DegV family protein [Pediococcus ethanolidurans]